MNTASYIILAILAILISWFAIVQVSGLVRDLKKKKNKKNETTENVDSDKTKKEDN